MGNIPICFKYEIDLLPMFKHHKLFALRVYVIQPGVHPSTPLIEPG